MSITLYDYLHKRLSIAEDFYQNDYPEEEDYDDVLDDEDGKLFSW
jgi:hypothetical protein